MNTLFLGSVDTGKMPSDTVKYLQPYHYLGLLRGTKSFRDDDRSKWRRFRVNHGPEVTQLQKFLYEAGFMPRGVIDGVYDYVTAASARLFQEYIRTVEGVSSMVPDGIIGNGTWQHVDMWQSAGKRADWVQYSSANPSREYRKWMKLLNVAKTYYEQASHPILRQVEQFKKPSDTRAPRDWEFDPNQIHLIGIRRKPEMSSAKRENDDVFILLVRGMVFKFWGSTDPSQKMAGSRREEAFLVEGQHKYRFGWHKISDERKIYRALRPYKHGVMVFRDWDDNNALTEADLTKGLDPRPNHTINIHWSGIGSTNYSAGCQVIAGKSYINHHDKAIDCSHFAAVSYSQNSDQDKKTKGAYNVLADLILSFAPKGVDYLYYTLGRENNLSLDEHISANYAGETLERMKSVAN
jgi:hypothetical protein